MAKDGSPQQPWVLSASLGVRSLSLTAGWSEGNSKAGTSSGLSCALGSPISVCLKSELLQTLLVWLVFLFPYLQEREGRDAAFRRTGDGGRWLLI